MKFLSLIISLGVFSSIDSNAYKEKEEDCYVIKGVIKCSNGTGTTYNTGCQTSPEEAVNAMYEIAYAVCPDANAFKIDRILV